MTNEQRPRADVTRRGVLKGTAALAGTAATAGTAGAYRDEIDFRLPATQNDGEGRTLSLLGIVGGWIGVAPAEIDGVSNPTLRLIEGEEHEIVWTNGDGQHHNFTVADADGEIIESTEFLQEQGESTTLTITPEEEMAQYYCIPHPVQMRGPIELIDPEEVHELRVRVEDEAGEPLGAEVFVGDQHSFSEVVARPSPPEEQTEEAEAVEPDPDEETGEEAEAETVPEEENVSDQDGADANQTAEGGADAEESPAIARFDMLENGEHEVEVWTYGHERVTETVEIDGDDQEVTVTLPAIEPDDPAETFSLVLEEGEWVGVGPDAIADESNPTLEVTAGESYAIEWENGIGRHQPEAENMTFEPLPGHNFVIASDGETNEWNTYVRSDFLDEEGDTQTVEFVAEEDMGVYLDQAQLDAIGEVVVDGEETEMGTETADADGNETADVNGNETVGNETADVDGNETAGNETAGNETVDSDGNESTDSAGNETADGY